MIEEVCRVRVSRLGEVLPVDNAGKETSESSFRGSLVAARVEKLVFSRNAHL